MMQYQTFNDFLRHIETNDQFISQPKTINEFGTKWIIGYSHLTTCDYQYEQYKHGITQQEAQNLFDRDLYLCEIALKQQYETLFPKLKYESLSIGSKKLLLLLYYHTGNLRQFECLISKCQEEKGFYEAVEKSGRKNIINRIENEKLQKRWEEEKRYFKSHFDVGGQPFDKQNQIQLLQITDELMDEANFLIENRYITFDQENLAASYSTFTNSNYLNKEFIEFEKSQEGKKYSYASYNEADEKWYPIAVPDQTYKIIGYSHICSPQQEKEYSIGLRDEHVNYLFLIDYQEKCNLLKKYLESYHPKIPFEQLSSQTQLFLIDIAFRNLNFHKFSNAIELAINGKIQEAIDESNIYYKPDLSVYAHLQQRTQELKKVVSLVDEQYFFKPKIDWNNEKYNNIVGITVNKQGFQFVFDASAACKIQFKDLITCLKVLYDPELDEGSKILYFSLEFEDNDYEMENEYQKKVYFPEYLEGTEVGEILYESDFILKQMSLGIEVINKQPLQVQEFNYGALPIQPLYKIDPDYFARLFLKYGGVKLSIVQDQLNDFHSYTIQDIELAVDAKYLDENGQDQQIQDPENAAVKFANNFIECFDKISHKYPVFIRLKQIFMANLLAKYMYTQKIEVDYNFVNEQFQQNLIPMYQKSKSPTLRMNIENEIMEFNLTGGVITQIEDYDKQLEDKFKESQNAPVTETQQTKFQTTDSTEVSASLSRTGSAYTISTIDSEKETEPLLKEVKCETCKKRIADSKKCQNQCLMCQGLQCPSCYKEVKKKEKIFSFFDKKLCKNCLHCDQCNKKVKKDQYQVVKDNIVHNQQSCISKCHESELKNKMLVEIKRNFETKNKNINQKKQNEVEHYFTDHCNCIQYKNYSGYVTGFYHALTKDNKIQQNFKAHYKVSKDQAEVYLKEDMLRIKDKFSLQIEDDVSLMKIFALFIIKQDDNLESNLRAETDYKRLYQIIQRSFKCPNYASHICSFQKKLEVLLKFFQKNVPGCGNKT